MGETALYKIETALPLVNMKLRIIVTLIAILALIQNSEQQEPDCDCDYHLGGCAISQAPPKGWKCVCVFDIVWHCHGWAEQCNENEECPADCFSQECCQRGGGDCGGYTM